MCGAAASFAVLNYIQLLGAVVTGYLVFGDVPGPSLWLGTALIIDSGLSVVYAERRRARR